METLVGFLLLISKMFKTIVVFFFLLKFVFVLTMFFFLCATMGAMQKCIYVMQKKNIFRRLIAF